MNDLFMVYLAALLYGCVLDVYAASAVRLISQGPVVAINDGWLPLSVLARILSKSQFGREYCKVLSSRTVWFPVVELITAACVTATIVRLGVGLEALAAAVLLTTVIVCAALDLELQIYPNSISYSLIGIGLIVAIVSWPILGFDAMVSRLTGGVLAFFCMEGVFRLWLRFRGEEALGQGDIKMMTAVGLFLGVAGFGVFVVVSFFFGSLCGLVLIASRRAHMKSLLPTGGFYVIGLVVVLLFPDIPSWYSSFVDDVLSSYGHSILVVETVGRVLGTGSHGAGVQVAP